MGKYKKALKKLNKAISKNDHASHEPASLTEKISNELQTKNKAKKKQCKSGHYFKGRKEITDCYTIVLTDLHANRRQVSVQEDIT